MTQLLTESLNGWPYEQATSWNRQRPGRVHQHTVGRPSPGAARGTETAIGWSGEEVPSPTCPAGTPAGGKFHKPSTKRKSNAPNRHRTDGGIPRLVLGRAVPTGRIGRAGTRRLSQTQPLVRSKSLSVFSTHVGVHANAKPLGMIEVRCSTSTTESDKLLDPFGLRRPTNVRL